MKLVLLLACAASAAGTAVGCSRVHDGDVPSAEEQKAENPLAGLHVPDSEIGLTEERRNAIAMELAGAGAGGLSDKDRELMEAMAKGGKCIGAEGAEGTPGMLTISFKSESYGGKYKPENCGAVWIEDAAGKYIATPNIWTRIRDRALFFYQAKRCKADQPDVRTSATLAVHQTHEITWDGKDLKDMVVPDGMYTVNIEVTEDELDYGRQAAFPFMKGPQPQTLMPADTESVKGLKLVYTPVPTTPGTGMDTGN